MVLRQLNSVLMDESGEIKNVVSEEYPLYFPHTGWSEQKPEDWEKGICTGLAKLLDGYDRGQIDGISFGGQMHGLVVLDSQDNVIRPAILWNDGRTGEEYDYLNNTIGRIRLPDIQAIWHSRDLRHQRLYG